jgi:hypothetical protein
MNVDPDDPLDFTPNTDDLVAKLTRTVQDSYDNGYRDGRADQHMEHAPRCPLKTSEARPWRDRGDGIFPAYPSLTLVVSACALDLADDTSATTAFFYVIMMWSVLAFITRLGLLASTYWSAGRRHDDDEKDD